MISSLARDVRFATRSLLKAPAFSLVAVLTLALGIGATTAIFSVVDGVLLRPLPYPAADRLVVPQSNQKGTDDRWAVSYGDFADWQENAVFQSAAVFQERPRDLVAGDEPQRVMAAIVSSDFLRTLGVAPVLGRAFRPEDFLAGDRVVLLGHSLWQTRFGGDRGIVGRVVRVNGVPSTVIGVLPADLRWPPDAEVWVPLQEGDIPGSDLFRRDNFIFGSVARLRPGRSLEQTSAQLAALAKRIEREESQTRAGVTVVVTPLEAFLLGRELPRALWVLLGAVGFVLLIGCVNIANLLLTRAAARQRELALRTALGASRWRLVRQALTESLLLSVVGGALGIALAVWGADTLVALAPADVPRLENVHLSFPVLAFAGAVSVLAALLFGLVPAFQASAAPPAALAEGGLRTSGGVRTRRIRNGLVVAELALSLTLLAGAGLMLRSFMRLQAIDPGFDHHDVLTFQVALPRTRYESDASVVAFYAEMVRRLGALPGVREAGVSSALPLGGGGFYLGRAFLPEGRPEPPAGQEVGGQWNIVGPGSFRSLGVPLLAGRDFTARDDSTQTPVMIVNERFATAMFGDADPIGRRVRSWRDENVLREIVGVVGDVRYMGAVDEPGPIVYVPHAQDPWRVMTATVRTVMELAGVTAAIRREVGRLDPELAVAEVATMEQVLSGAIARPRFSMLLLGGFALLALVLAAIGIYGVLSYTVSQRTREMGIRMALGARAEDVLRLVAREAVGVTLIGIAVGIAGALLATRLMRSLLYGVSATDPTTFAAVAAVLAGVALLAAFFPARRAARLDPLTALREE